MYARLHRTFLAAVALLAGAVLGRSATLSGSGQTAYPGDSVFVSLSLATGGQALSALQFDLTWDPSVDVRIAGGAQVGASTKMLYAALLQPRVVRCLVAGMNANSVGDGEVLRLFIAVNAGAAPGVAQLNLVNLSGAGPDGSPVFLQGGSVNVSIQAGSTAQVIQPSGILNGASLAAGAVAPGEVVTLFGSIAGGSPVVKFNGVQAPILYAGGNQVNAIVPFGLNPSTPAQVVIQQGASSSTVSVPVAAASPAIFTLSTTGAGPGAILNQNYSVNGATNPATQGTVIMVYATGFGPLNPAPADGQIQQGMASTSTPVTATIDGVAADVIYAGAAPGLIAGAEQINVRVPAGVKTNPAAPIVLTMGSFTTQPGVTLSVK